MFVFWCSGLYFCEFFVCLITTCNQIAIWYSRVVQLLVRETQSFTWLGAKPILRVNPRGRVRKEVLFCLQGIEALCTLGNCWAVETGLACRMKHLMQFNYCHIRSLPPLFHHILQHVVPYLMFTFAQVNSLYTSTVYEKNVTVNYYYYYFEHASLLEFWRKYHDVFAWQANMNKLLCIKGRIKCFISCDCFRCSCPWRVNLDHPCAVWW